MFINNFKVLIINNMKVLFTFILPDFATDHLTLLLILYFMLRIKLIDTINK